VEFRVKGYTHEAAIGKAVWRTGRIISFAGVIMIFAFGSLMFANTTMLNEFGAISSVAILVDTFVIRPLLVPALMSVVPSLVWWPRRLPPPSRDADDMQEWLTQRQR